MKKMIIPTVFAKTPGEFKRRFSLVTPLAKEIQIDFMDGKFHAVKGVMPGVVPDLHELPQSFEAHLMIAHPSLWIRKVAEKGFDRFLFHIESQKSDEATRQLIIQVRDAGMQPGIVLNPGTPLSRITPFLNEVTLVMFMAHRPGVENVGVEQGVLQKIRLLHEQYPELCIEVDGGVDDKTAPQFIKAGASRLSVGSYLSNNPDPQKAIAKLRRIL